MENYFRSNPKDLPFDQYQRYNTLAETVESLRTGKPLRVLDVGGYLEGGGQSGFIPAEVFLPGDEITVIDVKFNGPGRYVVGSGWLLPFRDRVFDVVSAMDTLEHIPTHRRAQFVAECVRVSSRGIVIAGPVRHPLTELAEQILDQTIRRLFKTPHPALLEHLTFGLPSIEEIKEWFDDTGVDTIDFPDGYLPNWLFMMIIKHHLMILENPVDLQRQFDRFYNSTKGLDDRCEPAYRQVFVAVRREIGIRVDRARFLSASKPPESPGSYSLEMASLVLSRDCSQLLQRIEELFLGEPTWFALRELAQERLELIADKDRTILRQIEMLEGKDRLITDLDQGIRSKDRELEELKRMIAESRMELNGLGERNARLSGDFEKLTTSHSELLSFRNRVIRSFPYRLYRLFRPGPRQ